MGGGTIMKPMNIYKPGTAKYYKDAVDNIGMVLVGYDGYSPTNAKHMRKLLDTIVQLSQDALRHKHLYIGEVQ